jgi:glycosyltransferase involved in cell wall biosynthesis
VRVSVVVPVYNHERYVEGCLASIDAQDHDDLEVIVIDDGSRDTSWERIAAHRWRASRRVQTLRTTNAGAHAALNRGLDAATGEWVALCNSDDWWAPGRVSTLLAAAAAAEARFVFSGVRYVDDDGVDVTETLPFARELHGSQRTIAAYPSVGWALVPRNVTISTGNFFFQRSLVAEIGYFRPYRYVHDWDFVLRALLVTEPLYVPEPLYFYRLHADNSFPQLESAAAVECPELMRRFMRAAVTERWPNRLAPSPRNWPVYFDHFVAEHAYQPYLVAWDGIDGVVYRPEGTLTAPGR